jgi:hypothetical protein
MSQAFTERVKELGLSLDQIIVIGSGILDQLGVRKAADVDLVADGEVLEKIASDLDWAEQCDKNQRRYFVRHDGSVEIWDGWEFDGQVLNYEELLKCSVEYDGVKFVSLDFLRQWKGWRRREKDMRDIRLIDEWRTNNE